MGLNPLQDQGHFIPEGSGSGDPTLGRGKGSWSGSSWVPLWDGQHRGQDRDTSGWETLGPALSHSTAQKNPAGQLIRRDCGDTGHSQQYLKRTDINFYQNIRAGVGKSHLELAKGSRISSSSHSQCPQGTRNCTGVIISSAFVQVGNKRHFPGPVQLWTRAWRVPFHRCCIPIMGERIALPGSCGGNRKKQFMGYPTCALKGHIFPWLKGFTCFSFTYSLPSSLTNQNPDPKCSPGCETGIRSVESRDAW